MYIYDIFILIYVCTYYNRIIYIHMHIYFYVNNITVLLSATSADVTIIHPTGNWRGSFYDMRSMRSIKISTQESGRPEFACTTITTKLIMEKLPSKDEKCLRKYCQTTSNYHLETLQNLDLFKLESM